VSATPEQIAERLEWRAEDQAKEASEDRSDGFEYEASIHDKDAAMLNEAAALIRAQADALKRITEMDGDQPARSDWDMVRIARAALKAAP
jgi:hypothetical protein